MYFLDHLQFDDPLFNMAAVLVAGIIGGELFALLKLPKVTGWIATGILLRSLNLPGMDVGEDPDALNKFQPFMSFVLGYIAFTVGATLYFASLRNSGKRIGLLLLFEALITPVVIAVCLIFIGPLLWRGDVMTTKAALLLAAIGIAGAPGTTVLVVRESRSRGILTKTLVAAIGLIDMVAVGVFVFVSIMLSSEGGWQEAMVAVATQFIFTFIIGASCAVIALGLTRTIVSPAFLGPTMVAVILGAWGLASGFGTSGGILACTFAGIVVTNLRHDTVRSVEYYLNSIGGVLFALFYTLAGMRLDFSLVPVAAALVALYFVARLIGKSISGFTAMWLSEMPDKVRNYFGLALMPHGGVAVGLILLIQSDPAFADEAGTAATVMTVGLAALAVNQLLGPSATRFSLVRAGEDHKDRPQLLDFLGENRIQTNLVGETREEVVRTLAGLLYKTSSFSVSQEEFVDQVLKRDADETTCLGRGLMIPHAILDEGEEIKGVLGISSEGLDLDAPDGKLVHAVLLLATPESDRNRHLQVLAAFATAITRDVNFSEQLYHARSPAHAYDVLHHEDQEDLNYFLEDAAERAGLRSKA